MCWKLDWNLTRCAVSCDFNDIQDEEKTHVISDALSKGIWDHLQTKLSAIRLGADAAITVLRVDQIIMAKTAGGPKPRGA